MGTTLANISRDWGLSKLIALSQVEYIYSGEQPLQYWKFRGTDAFTLHVRKDSSQARVTDCANCALLDLLAHEIRARGVVEVQKQPVNNDGTLFSDGFLPVLYQENFQAHTQLILDQNNERVVDQHILEDAPITTTHASTFLSLYEQTYRFFTERFVDINEQSGTHSDSVIAAYRTAYSNERTHIINNELTYEHNGCTTRVTPEGDALINAMLSWRAS